MGEIFLSGLCVHRGCARFFVTGNRRENDGERVRERPGFFQGDQMITNRKYFLSEELWYCMVQKYDCYDIRSEKR